MRIIRDAVRRHVPLAVALALAAGAYAPGTRAQDEPAPRPFAAPSQPQAQPPTPSAPPRARDSQPASPPVTRVGNNEVLLNFQAADIQAVIKAMSQMTGRNFLLDPRVKGQITIISAKPVPRAAAYQIFLSALKAQGFTAIEGPSGLVKIVPVAEAKQGADIQKGAPRGEEQITTHVAILDYVSPTQIVPLLRPLMAPTSQLSAHEPTNALIITDYADNVRRLLDIVERLDQPISSEVTVVPLQHASALDLADLIAQLAAPPGRAGGAPAQPAGAPTTGERFTIIPDLRTNSLLIRTENPGRLAQLRSLIAKLDVPATTGGQTRVVYLRNAEAVKLAEVLRGLLTAEARTQAQAAQPAAGARRVAQAQAASTAESSLIQADEATNALIINASDAVYNNLRGVIEKLDIRRAQVYVEALIAELTTDDAAALGIQWFAADDAGSGAVAGVTNFPSQRVPGIAATIADPGGAIAGASGLTLAFLGRTITLPDGTRVRGIGALARALESKSLANILSTPNLLTLDNAEAKITVGQNVPFLTGTFLPGAGTGTANVNPFQTIERQDVGIQLRIKPQISEGGGVKLEIFQEISSVTQAPQGVSAADIITNKRAVETTVLVDDGATVVLGGLIEERNTESRSQVPVLGRIPLLGALFRSKENTVQKTNLMIFLKPTIIRSVDDNYRVTIDRYEYMRALDKDKETSPALERLQPAPPRSAPAKDEEKPEPASEMNER